MPQRFATPIIRTSVNVSPQFHNLCRQHHIKFSEALRVGISILLAEKGVAEYDNTLSISRRLMEAKLKCAEYAKKISDLEKPKRKK